MPLFSFSMSLFKKLFRAFTTKERLIFLLSSAAAIVSFVVVISMLVSQATTATPMQGGTYTEGMLGQPEYINPVIATSQADLSLVKLVYANLNDIADNIDVSPDGKTWTIHLKNGLTWQDGQKLTSDDVIFTVQSIQNPDAKSPLAASWQGVTANRISELELTFTLGSSYAFFKDNLANLYIVPKHIFADVPPGNWRLSDYNLKPVGSGPYKFISYNEQADGFIPTYSLTAWNGFAGQKPLIQNINLQFFGNADDLIKNFNNGAVQGVGDITPAQLSDINRPYNLYTWRTSGYYAVFFNQSKNLALQDPNVREALSVAIDRDALVASALLDKGVADYGPIPPDANYYSADAAGPAGSSANSSSSPSDLAATILSQAGWTIQNSGTTSTAPGFRAKTIQKASIPLAINLTVPDIDFLVATAQALQNDWQSIGVQVTIATDTPANIVTNTIKNRDYEALLFGNILGPSSDLYSFWDSSQRFSPGLNLAIYQNKKVDALIEDARQNLSDASRTIEFTSAQANIISDNPAIFLYSPDYLFAANKNIQGIQPNLLPDPSNRFRDMTQWYLNAGRILK